jgi:telomere length regulation protein
MKGWLVAMASLLEVNGGSMRRLCETQGREVMETREWVAMVFEKTRGEDGGEENEVKMLAAGVLIRLGEAIERYQALLMGDLVGFQ